MNRMSDENIQYRKMMIDMKYINEQKNMVLSVKKLGNQNITTYILPIYQEQDSMSCKKIYKRNPQQNKFYQNKKYNQPNNNKLSKKVINNNSLKKSFSQVLKPQKKNFLNKNKFSKKVQQLPAIQRTDKKINNFKSINNNNNNKTNKLKPKKQNKFFQIYTNKNRNEPIKLAQKVLETKKNKNLNQKKNEEKKQYFQQQKKITQNKNLEIYEKQIVESLQDYKFPLNHQWNSIIKNQIQSKIGTIQKKNQFNQQLKVYEQPIINSLEVKKQKKKQINTLQSKTNESSCEVKNDQNQKEGKIEKKDFCGETQNQLQNSQQNQLNKTKQQAFAKNIKNNYSIDQIKTKEVQTMTYFVQQKKQIYLKPQLNSLQENKKINEIPQIKNQKQISNKNDKINRKKIMLQPTKQSQNDIKFKQPQKSKTNNISFKKLQSLVYDPSIHQNITPFQQNQKNPLMYNLMDNQFDNIIQHNFPQQNKLEIPILNRQQEDKQKIKMKLNIQRQVLCQNYFPNRNQHINYINDQYNFSPLKNLVENFQKSYKNTEQNNKQQHVFYQINNKQKINMMDSKKFAKQCQIQQSAIPYVTNQIIKIKSEQFNFRLQN